MKLSEASRGGVFSRHEKYTTRNPLSRYLVRGLFRRIASLISGIPFDSVLDVGCGEGLPLHHLGEHLAGKRVIGVDVDRCDVETARSNVPFAKWVIASVYSLPFRDRGFDLTICCEVLEHLEDPDLALKGIARVAAKHCVFSVPNEPLWRALNMARGAYVWEWGNTPGHRNHWSRRSFERLIVPRFEVLKIAAPPPWLVVLCRPKDCQAK